MSSTVDSYVNHIRSVTTGDGRQIEIDDLVDIYRGFAKTPVPFKCQLYDGDNERQKSLRIVSKFQDLDRLEETKFVTNYSIKLSEDCNRVKHISSVGEAIDVSNELRIRYETEILLNLILLSDRLAYASRAQGSQYTAVVRKGAKDSESGKMKQWLEIWDKTTKVKSIDIDSIEEHSSIVLRPEFGRFLWAPNGKQLLYVANYKPPKAQSYFKKSKKSETSDKDPDTRGQEFVYREDWGEKLDGVCHTVVAILDVETDFKIRTIEMSGHSLAQPFWLNSGESVGFVAINEKTHRLGIAVCVNRLSAVFTVDLNSDNSLPKLVCGSDNISIRHPRRTPDGKGFIYLENESGGAHYKASRLMKYDIESKTNEVLVDINGIRDIIETKECGLKYGKITTLFIDEMLDNCFTCDGRHVLINCFTELHLILILVDLKTGDLTPIEFPLESAHLIGFKDDLIVTICSSLNVAPNVFVAKLNADITRSMEWSEIKVNSSDSLSEISSQNYWIQSEDKKKLLSCALVAPKGVESHSSPTVVYIHGGPHRLIFNRYMTSPINSCSLLFANLGLKTMFVNYRGSIGVDEEYVNALPGNVGDMDVKDVIECIKYFKDRGLIDGSKLVLFGASHGGFLATHLSGQSSHMDFKACIAWNPVIDMSVKMDGTDIPDLTVFESFGKSKSFSFDEPIDPESLEVMFKKSPINWISNVKVPTLMILGKRDRRVSMNQGLKYYRLLKARGVKTQCHIYDDNHSIPKVDFNADITINTCLWILDNLKPN